MRRASPCPCGGFFVTTRGHTARETAEELAPRLEDSIARKGQSGLERLVPPALTSGVMDPGLRSQARFPGRRRPLIRCPHTADSILSPHALAKKFPPHWPPNAAQRAGGQADFAALQAPIRPAA